ncbi:unnamed protein product, partial [marine sediment metagenome]
MLDLLTAELLREGVLDLLTAELLREGVLRCIIFLTTPFVGVLLILLTVEVVLEREEDVFFVDFVVEEFLLVMLLLFTSTVFPDFVLLTVRPDVLLLTLSTEDPVFLVVFPELLTPCDAEFRVALDTLPDDVFFAVFSFAITLPVARVPVETPASLPDLRAALVIPAEVFSAPSLP